VPTKTTPTHADKSDATGIDALRNDSMMAHLLDSLDEKKDIGHYGRLVFAMVARHFLPHEEVIEWLKKDSDFSEEQAQLLLKQVEGRDYNPPRRDRILEWQCQQEFPILPNPADPDCGNLYRNLKFPDAVFEHIGHYQEEKQLSSSARQHCIRNTIPQREPGIERLLCSGAGLLPFDRIIATQIVDHL
jgi:hypothetical protein